MLSDLYVFSVLGKGSETIHMITPKKNDPSWIPAGSVLTAVAGSGGYHLYFLCGVNHYRDDKPCSEYPLEVYEIWEAYTPGSLRRRHAQDVAAELLGAHVIGISVIDKTGRIDSKASLRAQTAFNEGEKEMERQISRRFLVTVVDQGETCDGHTRKLGVAETGEEARKIIEEDKVIFRKLTQETGANQSLYSEEPNEIWYDDAGEGRIYDVIEI